MAMAKLKSMTIENFRSIKGPLKLEFKENTPLILIGENNSGKANIIRCLEIMFGEFYPKYKDFDEHDHYERNKENTISMKCEVEDFKNKLGKYNQDCILFSLTIQKGVQYKYVAIQSDRSENPYVSNELREELFVLNIGPEQNLSYQLSYTTKYTLLSRLTKAFHKKLIENKDREQRLKDIFNQTINIFNELSEFNDFKENISSLTGEYIKNMSYKLDLDFSAYYPSNYFKNLNVYPHENNVARSFEELGTGQQQILLLSFAHAYARFFRGHAGLILIFDEPESHLHPLAQKWLAKTIYHMVKDGIEIVVSTHSPYFITLNILWVCVLFAKNIIKR